MAPISFPFTLTPGTPENVNQLNANLNAILAQFNGNIELAQLAPSVQALLVPNVPAEFQAPVLDVGLVGQLKAGRQLAGGDFTTLCGLPTLPAGLFNLGDLSNIGSAGALLNKGVVTFASGINGTAATAAQFTGSTGQALYINDTGASDPFRLKAFTFGAWSRTAKLATTQTILSKGNDAANTRQYTLDVSTTGVVQAAISTAGTSYNGIMTGITNVVDDRWHFIVFSFDGNTYRLFVDGVLEASVAGDAVVFQAAGPFNIGARGADAGTAGVNPHFGRIDEAFVTGDILSDDQIRLLYCAKIAHGFASAPTSASLLVRRRKRGGDFITTDFPSQPIRLYNFAAGVLTDAGTGNVTLTNNNTALAIAGADGTKDNAFNFVAASSQSLSSTDAGLPSGTAARTLGCWIKTTTLAAQYVLAYGTTGTVLGFATSTAGTVLTTDGVTNYTGSYVADGQWHFVVAVWDNAALDGQKTKIYTDGLLTGSGTTFAGTTLGGANALRVGCFPNPVSNFFNGQIDGAFVHSAAFTPDQIATLYAKGSQALPPSVREPGVHIEGFDATNIYATFDTLESTYQIDLKVAL